MQNFDQIFSDLDLDNDNKLQVHDCQKVLQQLQISFYPGMIQSLIDYSLQADKMSRQALKTYCSYTLNGFKVLYELDTVIKDYYKECNQCFADMNKNQSAGASPSPQIQYNQQNIKVKLQVGPDSSYNTNINVQVNKFKDKTFQKPSIKIVFFPQLTKSNEVMETLKQITTIIKDTLINFIEQYTNLINAIEISIYPQGDNVVLEFSSQCQELMKTLQNLVQMPDYFFKDELTEASLKLQLGTGLNFMNLFQNSDTCIFDYLGSSFSLSVDYHGNPTLLKLYQQLAVAANTFQDCKNNKSIRTLLKQYLIQMSFGTLEDVDIDLKFNNITQFYHKIAAYTHDFNPQQQDPNRDTIAALIQLIVVCQNDEYLSFIPKFLQLFYNNCISKLQVHVEVSKAQVDLELSVQNLGYLYKKVLQQKASNDQ